MSEDMVTVLPEVNEVIREQLKRLRCKQMRSRPTLEPADRKCNKCKLWHPMENMTTKKYGRCTVWICSECLHRPDARLSRK
jgi:hypothetical protein